MTQDLIRFCLGDAIASGEYRCVYNWSFRKDVVCKITWNQEANWAEFNTWSAVKDTHYAKWFAPVIEISACGHFMLMKKARPVNLKKDKLPRRIPNMFTDVKLENFGFIGDQFVCVDYQFLDRSLDLAMNSGMVLTSSRMKELRGKKG